LDRLAIEAPPVESGDVLALGDIAFDDVRDPGREFDRDATLSTEAAMRSGAQAGPLRGGVWERGFDDLPATRVEVESIAKLYEQAAVGTHAALVLSRDEATRQNLFALAPRARFLHMATHGWFTPEFDAQAGGRGLPEPSASPGFRIAAGDELRGMSPMVLCGLALAGANRPVDSNGRITGLVTAEELATLDLSGCQLAVLSACDTNVGLRRAGQGVASLQRALHMAGARSVITSLWKVPDEATGALMVDFYRRLWIEGEPKSTALWKAKMAIRDARDETGKRKYSTRDWAAWVLTGDPR
jgi:CHAT domain-containing protein